MKKLFTFLAAAAVSGTMLAQNSAIYKADALIKSSDYAGAITLLDEAVANPKTTKQAEMYHKMGQCHYQLLTAEFIKAAQNAPFDTLAYYNHLDQAIGCILKSHEADNTPDEKGRVKAKFIAQNKDVMKHMLQNYWYAAIFAAKSNDNRKSRDFFVKHVEMPKNAVLADEADSIYAKNPDYRKAIYFAAVQSYEIKDWPTTLKYVDEALKGDEGVLDLYRIKLTALQECAYDSVNYNEAQRQAYDTQFGETLGEAVARTGDESMMGSLVTYYMQKQDRKNAVAKADELLAKEPNNARLHYIKGIIEMNMPPYNYEVGRKCFEKAVELNPEYYLAYKNLGASYINEMEERLNRDEFHLPTPNTQDKIKEYRRIMQEKVYPTYNKAKDIYEKLRSMTPDQPDLWAEGLYAVYTRLLMQEQADEMKQYLN